MRFFFIILLFCSSLSAWAEPGSSIPSWEAELATDEGTLGWINVAVELRDGTILVGGRFDTLKGVSRHSLVRLLSDGSVDTSFDAHLPGGAIIEQILPRRDGSMYLRGSRVRTAESGYMDMVRLKIDGTADTSFSFTYSPNVTCAALQGDDTLLVCCTFPENTTGHRGLMRLTENGAIDFSFKYTHGILGANAITVQPNGGILLGWDAAGYPANPQAGVIRIHPGGEFDEEFYAKTKLAGIGGRAAGLTLQPDGKILAAGNFLSYQAGTCTTVVRFLPDGVLDTTFQAPILSDQDYRSTFNLYVQADGRIVCGYYYAYGPPFRLEASGQLDATFQASSDAQRLAGLVHSGDMLVSAYPGKIRRLAGGLVENLEPPSLNFRDRQFEVAETAGYLQIPVVRTGSTAESASVRYATNDGTAHDGVDYTETSGTLNFAPGERFQWFTIPVLDTVAIEGTRSLQVTLSNAQGATLRTNTTATIQVLDNELPGRIELEKTTYVVREGGAVIIKFIRTLGTMGDVSVHVRSVNVTSTGGSDFDPLDEVVTFSSGSKEQILVLNVRTDGLNEGDETLNISLSEATGTATLGPKAVASILIRDIDDPGSVDLNLTLDFPSGYIRSSYLQEDGCTVIVGDFSGSGYNYIARLQPNGAIDDSFHPATVGGRINVILPQQDGFIIAGDFTSVDGNSKVRVAKLTREGALDLTYNRSGLGPDATILAAGMQPDGKVIIAGNFTKVAGATRVGMARLLPDGSYDSSFQPPVTTSIADMAVRPSGEVLYPGMSNRIIQIKPNGREDPSFFAYISLGGPGTPRIESMALDHQGRLLIAGLFQSVTGVNRPNFARVLTTGKVDETFQPDSALFKTAADVLAIQPDGRILWASSGQAPNSIVRLLDNGSTDTSFRVVSTPDVFNGTIRSLTLLPTRLLVSGSFMMLDEVDRSHQAYLLLGVQPGTFRFAEAPMVQGNEGEVSIIQVTRIGGSDGIATVRFETISGSAQPDVDFQPVSGTLNFPAGVTSAIFQVQVLADGKYEPTEELKIRLSQVEGAYLNSLDTDLRLSIPSNDPPQRGVISFASGSLGVSEDEGRAVLHLQRLGGADETATVTYTTVAETALAMDDFVPTSGTVSLAAGVTEATIDVPLVKSGLAEPEESFYVQLAGAQVGAQSAIKIFIEDHDQATVAALRGVFRVLLTTANQSSTALLDLTLSAHEQLTGKLRLDGKLYNLRTNISDDGRATAFVLRKGATPMLLNLVLDVHDQEQKFMGSLVVDGINFSIRAVQRANFSQQNPAAMAGRYNVAFEALQAGKTNCAGYAQLTVSPRGAVRMIGQLADGTPVSTSTFLDGHAHATFFVSLPHNGGLLYGDYNFTQTAGWHCDASAFRAHSQTGATSLENSNAIPLTARTSRVSSDLLMQGLGCTEGTARLFGSNLVEALSVNFHVGAKKVTFDSKGAGLALSLHPSDGLFTGKFLNPTSHRVVRFRGVALPELQQGLGFFHVSADTGTVEFLTFDAEQ